VDILPETVDQAYERILEKSIDKLLSRKLLNIVIAACRPLTLSEMNIALAIKENTTSYKDLNLEADASFEKTVRNLCGLFVVVVDKKIYLLHQTARDFLLAQEAVGHHIQPQKTLGLSWHSNLSFKGLLQRVNSRGTKAIDLSTMKGWNRTLRAFNPSAAKNSAGSKDSQQSCQWVWRQSFKRKEINETLAILCLTYLYFEEFTRWPLRLTQDWPGLGPEDRPEDWPQVRCEQTRYLAKHPFLDYSAKFWTTHFGAAADILQADTVAMAVNICDTYQQRDLALTWFRIYTSAQAWPYPPNPSTLVIASFCGLETLIEPILGLRTVGIEDTDNEGRTALYWAFTRGHISIENLLLKNGANLSSRDWIPTPLAWPDTPVSRHHISDDFGDTGSFDGLDPIGEHLEDSEMLELKT
jgi:ankyrin repeat domain-containing protein 50